MEKHLLHLVRVFDQIRRFEFDFVWPGENSNTLKNENETYILGVFVSAIFKGKYMQSKHAHNTHLGAQFK